MKNVMPMPGRVAEPVKRCLFAMGAGMLALALVACTQTSEPEETEEPEAAQVAENAALEKPARKTVRKHRTKAAPKVELQTQQPAPKQAMDTHVLEAPQAEPATQMVAPSYPMVQIPANFVPTAPGKRIARVNVPGPYVAVTFDDGPSAALTPKVLDIFNRHGARATFFVLGRNANSHRSLLARAVAEGHEVGSHTWSHINMQATPTPKIISELDRTAKVIEQATGNRPKVMRPPYGSINGKLVNMVCNRYGTPAILWDVDTNDWRKPGVQKIINLAVSKAKPGSIILLHDIHPSTLAAVEGLVTGLQARGFTLVTVSELIAMGRQAAGVAAPARQATEEHAAVPGADVPATSGVPAPAAPQQPVPAAPQHYMPGIYQPAQPIPGSASMGDAPISASLPAAPGSEPTTTTQ